MPKLANPIPRHSLDWWVNNTPACMGPFCINVFYDHVDFSFEIKW